jgi:hypothetical protein
MGRYWAMLSGDGDILRLILGAIADFFRSWADLQTEIIALHHQHVLLFGGPRHHYFRI